MATQGGFYQSVQFTGLVETDIGVPDAGTYNVDVKLQIPSRVQSGSDSAVIITIKDGSSTKYTGTAGATGAWVQITGVSAGDILKVILSSANAIDAGLNAVQGTIAVSLAPGY
jgi:hypothetical protein